MCRKETQPCAGKGIDRVGGPARDEYFGESEVGMFGSSHTAFPASQLEFSF